MYDIVAIVLTSVNVLLHSICLILLAHVYWNENEHKPQSLYLLNLSAVELVRNLNTFFNFVYMYGNSEKMISVYHTSAIFVFITYVGSMFLITVDRLVAVLLNFRYKRVCNLYRVKIAILCIWRFSVLVTLK